MKTVKCQSGATGWRDRLRNIYPSLESFEQWSEVYGLHQRLGYAFAVDAWNDNPVIEGSVIPTDFRVVERGDKKKKKPAGDTEPDYSHKRGEYTELAPPEPLLHKCPECEANEDEGERNTKKKSGIAFRRQTHRLTYLRSRHETWGTCVTRHDVYRCRSCRTKWVSTNGREPEVAAPDI